MTNDGGKIIANGLVNLTASNDVQNSATLNLNQLTFTGNSFTNADGKTIARQISIDAATLNNKNGQMLQRGTGTSNIKASVVLDNTDGFISSDGHALITVGDLINQVVANQNGGAIQTTANANLTLTATGAINNASGSLFAGKTLSIASTGNIDNRLGRMSSSDTLNIYDPQATSNPSAKTQSITNTGGTLIADRLLTIDSASLSGDGSVLSNGDLNARLWADYTHEVNARFQSKGDATLETAGSLVNYGRLFAGQTLSLKATAIDNTANGDISGGDTALQVSSTLTNRGLIDGSDTYIHAATLNNLGTGRIYGDYLALQADTLTNDAENGMAAVIAAREQLDIGVNTLTNQEHALLFSAGDMAIGGSLDVWHQAIGQAGTLNNNSATIEATWNLALSAATINNTNAHFSTQEVLISTQAYDEFQGQNGVSRYTTPAGTPIQPNLQCSGDCQGKYNTLAPNPDAYATSVRDSLYQWMIGGVQLRDAYRYLYTRNIT